MALSATEIVQGTEEWYAIRGGKLTASRLSGALAKTKSGWGASRANLAATLIVERLTGSSESGHTSTAMQWGIDTEPLARSAYEFSEDVAVDQIGFIDHPTISMAGCSPDGLINDDGMLEVKCPNTSTHIHTLLHPEKVDKKYMVQVQWQMACAGRLWCDLVSFDPRLPLCFQMHVIRIERDQLQIEQLQDDAKVFLAEVADLEARLKVMAANKGASDDGDK